MSRLLGGLLIIVLLTLNWTIEGNALQSKQFKILLFTKTDGWHHKSIHEGVAALRKMADKHHFDMEWHEDAARINSDNLKKFDVIVFLNTTGNILNEQQQVAMEKFIQSGKGFVGIHSASDTEYDWPWYQKLVGRNFKIHPVIQTATLKVEARDFPGLTTMPDTILWTDEWYEFGPEQVSDLQYILSIDEATYSPEVDWGERGKGTGMGVFHPVSWYHDYDGGRSFYTALGHVAANYSDDKFLNHLFGGLYWAATGRGLSKEAGDKN